MPTTTDPAAAEREALQRLAELREKYERLAAEAAAYPELGGQLEELEGQIAACELEAARAQAALGGLERRAEQDAVEAAAARRAEALERARLAADRRAKAAKTIDDSLRRFAKALAGHYQASLDLTRALFDAGEGGLGGVGDRSRYSKGLTYNAFVRALLDAEVPLAALERKHGRLDSQPLAEAEADLLAEVRELA